VMTSLGYGFPGALLQCGATYDFSWNPWYDAGYIDEETGLEVWEGTHTWGIGLGDRKDVLLLDPDGAYELCHGTINTTNLAPGHYVLTLVPDDTTRVLKPGVDLSVAQDRVLQWATSVGGPDSIEFDIAEP
jgi:hypothetical protein